MTAPMPQTSFDKWRRHFNSMIEGKLGNGKKIILVNDRPQVGKGLEIISPAAQTLEMARAMVKTRKTGVKRRRVSSKPQMKAKRRRGRTTVKKTKLKKRRKVNRGR